MKRYGWWIVAGVMLLALVPLVVWSFSHTPMVPQASEVWSRGRVVARTPIKRPVALQPAPGGGVFLVWSNLDNQLELVHTGVDGEILLDSVLPMEMEKARDPQLQVGPDGRLHLLWREEGGPHATVRYAVLEADGNLVGQVQILSDPASSVLDAPRLARGAQGRRHTLWSDQAGIYWTVLSEEGGVLGGPTLLVPGGRYPMVQMDDDGRLHMVWQRGVGSNVRGIYYAVLDLEKGELGDSEEIVEIVLSGLQLQAMALGLDSDTSYVLWSDYDRTFDRYRFMYASFPLGTPQQKQITTWQLKVGDGPLAIFPLDGQQTSLLVALSERITSLERGMELQITMITVGQDEAEEQVVTASTQASVKPVLVVDDRSHLHLAWLETAGFGEYRVVYASTAPEVMENYNAVTLWDGLNAALSNVFRLSTMVVTAWAVFIVWAIFPLLGLLIYHLITSEETLDTVRSRVALITALAVEVALSFARPPLIGVDVDWSALRWVVPIIAAVVTAAITVRFLRRRVDKHLFGAFFLFTVVNSLVQIALYLLLQG
jgi:hypothetical protein